MKRLLNRFKRFVDFCICLCFFPYAISLIRFLKVRGLNTIAERFFLYVVSKNIPIKGDILEIGSFMGSSSLLLAAGNEVSQKKGEVWLIEPYPRPNKESFLNLFNLLGLDKHIKLIDRTSEDARNMVNSKFRFIFIDGNHDYAYVKKDILLWGDCLNDGGIIAFHDRNFDGVLRAVNEYIHKSDKFIFLGMISGILYFSKGNYAQNNPIPQLKRLGSYREVFMKISRMFSLGEDE